MSFGGSDGGRGRGRGDGRYGGRGGGVGGGFGGGFGGGGHNPCPLCGNRHHPGQTCWPLCAFCGQRHHARSVCEPRQWQQQQRQERQQQTGYAGGHQGALRDLVLGFAQQQQAENEVLRATVDALQTRFNAFETRFIAFATRVNAAMASPLALRASTQHGTTLAATQGVQTAGGITGLKRPREQDAGADATGDLEATGQLAPSKKRKHRGSRRKKPAVEGAESIKGEGEGEGEGKDDGVGEGEDENETIANDVFGPVRPPKAKPLLFSAPFTRVMEDAPLPPASLPFALRGPAPVAPRRLAPLAPAPIAPAALGTTVPSQQQASVRRFSGFEFTVNVLVTAATPAQGLDAGRAAIVQQAADYLAALGSLEQRGYARRAENNGHDPVTQLLNEWEGAEGEQAEAAKAPLPDDDDLYNSRL